MVNCGTYFHETSFTYNHSKMKNIFSSYFLLSAALLIALLNYSLEFVLREAEKANI